MMTRWLAYIRLFDFDTKHVPGTKHGAADAISRRGYCEEDGELSDDDAVDDFFEAKMYSVMIEPAKEHFAEINVDILCIYLNEEEYEGDDLMLGRYLSTMQRPEGLTDLEYQLLRKKSKPFFIRDGYLYKKGKRSAVPHQVGLVPAAHFPREQ